MPSDPSEIRFLMQRINTNSFEHEYLDSRESSAELPEVAARVGPSTARDIDMYDEELATRQRRTTLEVARDASEQSSQRATKKTHAQHLLAHDYRNRGDPTIEAAHE